LIKIDKVKFNIIFLAAISPDASDQDVYEVMGCCVCGKMQVLAVGDERVFLSLHKR
jgi:hypothetical protein